MLKKLLLISTLFVATLAHAAEEASGPKAISPTVAVVNIQFIMFEVPQFKAVNEKLAKEFKPRQAEVEKLKQQGEKLVSEIQGGKLKGDKLVEAQRKVAEIQADLGLKAKALQEDVRKRESEETKGLQSIIQSAIDDIAKERGIQLVLVGGQGLGVAYVAPVLDISQEVIDRVSKKK